jgi:predicted aldo/keto reductase-like oxidoreductase
MQYRQLGNTGVEVSALGIGCMRLPVNDDLISSTNINEPATVELIRRAIDGGINYIDTAFVYHGQRSEEVLGKALLDGYRDKAYVATKLQMAMVNETADFRKTLEEQLRRLQTDHIDFYLLHGIGADMWEKTKRLDILSHVEKARDEGKISHICFSFHDNYEAFERIINEYDNWSMAQVMYNYMDEDNQAGRKGIDLAASKGIGIVVMEPLRGGKLATPIPAVQELLDAEGYTGNFTELGFRWVWDNENVAVALSGMTTLEQLNENLVFAEGAVADNLGDFERQLIEKIRTVYKTQSGIPCTSCGYCLPCPQGVRIPYVFELYNEKLIYNYGLESRRVYNLFKPRAAEGCIACGVCEEKCPQKIPISEWMPKIHAELAE